MIPIVPVLPSPDRYTGPVRVRLMGTSETYLYRDGGWHREDAALPDDDLDDFELEAVGPDAVVPPPDALPVPPSGKGLPRLIWRDGDTVVTGAQQPDGSYRVVGRVPAVQIPAGVDLGAALAAVAALADQAPPTRPAPDIIAADDGGSVRMTLLRPCLHQDLDYLLQDRAATVYLVPDGVVDPRLLIEVPGRPGAPTCYLGPDPDAPDWLVAHELDPVTRGLGPPCRVPRARARDAGSATLVQAVLRPQRPGVPVDELGPLTLARVAGRRVEPLRSWTPDFYVAEGRLHPYPVCLLHLDADRHAELPEYVLLGVDPAIYAVDLVTAAALSR